MINSQDEDDSMRMAMIGLGKMGGNMARRLLRGGIEVVGSNRGQDIIDQLQKEDGLLPASSLSDAVKQLSAPRVVWLMLPAGEITEQVLAELLDMLEDGDLVIDGGNANYHDSQRRAAIFADHNIQFMDAGTSGGIWGLENGYCLMVGGTDEAAALIAPALKILAPSEQDGWAHVGPVGAGHFTKMIHNGIEYGMMQAMAEGFALMKNKPEFDIDLAQVSELWRHSSVVRSWLLDLTASALDEDQVLDGIEPIVADSGEGRWTAVESIDQGTPAPVIMQALSARFSSQGSADFANRVLAMMRKGFGGHAVVKK
jgi:6-phosphogluconate dehydrogenase